MKNFIWALVIIVILGGAYMLYQNSLTAAPESGTSDTTGTTQKEMPVPGSDTPETDVNVNVSVGVGTPASAAVTYDGKSFSPSEVTIKKGGTVTWINNSDGEMWVASAQHPSHTVYSGTSRTTHCPDNSNSAFDQCAGETGNYSFTFQKTGSWGYHNHLNAQIFGKVIVVE